MKKDVIMEDNNPRFAHIGDHDGEWFVSFVNWETREGGGIEHLTKKQALALAKKFVLERCEYRFDKDNGIVLDLRAELKKEFLDLFRRIKDEFENAQKGEVALEFLEDLELTASRRFAAIYKGE